VDIAFRLARLRRGAYQFQGSFQISANAATEAITTIGNGALAVTNEPTKRRTYRAATKKLHALVWTGQKPRKAIQGFRDHLNP
jgi:hypothetical protein